MKLHILAAVAALTLASAGAASAAITVVTNVGALGADDSINWTQLGGDYTIVSPPVAVVTTLGHNATLSSGGSLEKRTQGPSWNGNFSDGEALIWTNQQGPDITLTFANLVRGVGAQIQADFFGDFTAEIIGSDGGVLGTFTENGYSDSSGEGSAIFIGLLSDTANIKSIRFDLTSASDGSTNDFAIGHVSIASGGAVPEPASWALMILGMGAVGGLARTRRRMTATA